VHTQHYGILTGLDSQSPHRNTQPAIAERQSFGGIHVRFSQHNIRAADNPATST
jgi:hypothetical protein